MMRRSNFNDIYKGLIKKILLYGHKISPRGLGCTEIICNQFTLTDPRNSLLMLKERQLSYKFNAAEKLCYITGNSGEDILTKYSSNIGRFINPKTKKFDGSYGPRLIKQYQYILDLLKHDPSTRQAILNINNYHEDLHKSLDIPCTCTLQFFIRDDKLHLIVYMRSNDLLWGTPYDVSQFTFIQECFANILKVDLGMYTHITGSLHIYDKDIEIFKRIFNSNKLVDKKYWQLPVDITTWEQLQDQSKMTLNNDIYPNSHDFGQPLTEYFKNLHQILHG